MTIENENPHSDSQDDEAVSMFNQLTEQDSNNDSDSDDEMLDQENDTGMDDGGDDGQDDGEQEADPWANAPETLRQQFQQLQQSHQQLNANYNATVGRLAPTQRELEALRKQMAEREKQNGGADENSDMPSAEDLKGKSFSEVEEEWPEVAEFLKHQIQQAKQEITQQLTPLQQRYELQQQQEQQQQQQAIIQQEYNRLAQAHPDYQQVVSNPAFNQWLSKQPPALQKIAQSDSADDAKFVLDQYKGASGKSSRNKRNNLADHVSPPRQGAGRAATSQISDDIDPVDLYNRLNPS
ncbi:hypothetical protein [Rheinheimera sp. MMS21-TC3]|uniref:hypothetical protein n=1 Tax=Rheinheimera sp. MMS21-TC3 TaxID=3072790 RepID=UPI0028C39C43|nr:hypothetical protein [Rheinheimera sp. MMS21-TC3]WNO60440.1 hypothetical protein RDV63_05600 [Rheinheimera sp. MMS21-TC3]